MQYKNVLVFGEVDGSHLSSLTTELMRVGKNLSKDLKEELDLLLLSGKSDEKAESEGFAYGADRVVTISDPFLDDYMTDTYLHAMKQIIAELQPSILLFGHNDKGLDLAPRLAFRLKSSVALDCVDLKIDKEKGLLELVKPVFGGKAHAKYIAVGSHTRIASVREGAFEPADYDNSKKGKHKELIFSFNPSSIRTRFLNKKIDENVSLVLKLTSAKVVVGGGRGLKKREGVELIQETADLLGGAIGGSRPAIDCGWISNSLQIGLTGKKIQPQVYIAVGISGAAQHMAGCSKSKTIIAINSDEGAPIFKMSHYGVVGDYKEILAGFNNEIKRNMGKISTNLNGKSEKHRSPLR